MDRLLDRVPFSSKRIGPRVIISWVFRLQHMRTWLIHVPLDIYLTTWSLCWFSPSRREFGMRPLTVLETCWAESSKRKLTRAPRQCILHRLLYPWCGWTVPSALFPGEHQLTVSICRPGTNTNSWCPLDIRCLSCRGYRDLYPFHRRHLLASQAFIWRGEKAL